MYHETEPQRNHAEHILEVLQEAIGQWVDGAYLTKKVGTTNLSARLGTLKSQGWIIESRAGDSSGGFRHYRLLGKGRPQGRRKLVLSLPRPPAAAGAQGWSLEAVERLQRAAEQALEAEATSIAAEIRYPDLFSQLEEL
jgi:hypothetical protein